MTFPSRFFFLLLLTTLLASSALAVPVPITTREYVTFLNAVAAADPEGLYEEKMGSQATACPLITRSGVPGSYTYAVAPGEKDLSISYVSQANAENYCDWRQDAASTSTFNFNLKIDSSIRSNRIVFQDLREADKIAEKSSNTKNSSVKEMLDALAIAGVIAADIGGETIAPPETAVRRSPEERENPRQDPSFLQQASTSPETIDKTPSASSFPITKKYDITTLPDQALLSLLNSPEEKKAALETTFTEAARELKNQHPLHAQKIEEWESAIYKKNHYSDRAQWTKEAEALASKMPPELDPLVALSQAMEVIDNATAYSLLLRHAWDKVSGLEDPESTSDQLVLLSQVEPMNIHLQELEEAADSIVTLSAQKSRCLASAAAAKEAAAVATATPATAEANNEAAAHFEKAAQQAKAAITFYLAFSQKMKKGDISTASQSRLQGRICECQALKYDYKGQSSKAYAEGDTVKGESFDQAGNRTSTAIDKLIKAAEEKNYGFDMAAEADEQAAQYHLCSVKAHIDGDNVKGADFALAGYWASCAANNVVLTAPEIREGKKTVLKYAEHCAAYFLRRAEIATQEGSEKGHAFSEEMYEAELQQQKST